MKAAKGNTPAPATTQPLDELETMIAYDDLHNAIRNARAIGSLCRRSSLADEDIAVAMITAADLLREAMAILEEHSYLFGYGKKETSAHHG